MATVSLCKSCRCFTIANCRFRGYRYFSSGTLRLSGHNRWSKIKHDKGKEDAKKTKKRSALAHELRLASSLSGPDIDSNPRLATLVATAKKLGFPKESVENAISRGQGRSMAGEALDSMTIEALFPDSAAIIIECQTDSKARTLADIRSLIKDFGGKVATTNHLFEQKGKVVFGRPSDQGDEALFERLIETDTIGADFADGDRLIVFTQPNQTKGTAEAISNVSKREIESREIFWDPKPETRVDAASEIFTTFINRLREDPSVQNIYSNVALEEDQGFE